MLPENHDREQYFFDDAMLDVLSRFLVDCQPVCCVCAPFLGQRLVEDGVATAVLDLDRRFESVSGFTFFDLNRPVWQPQQFGIIFCDPPFFNVSLSQHFSKTSIRPKTCKTRFENKIDWKDISVVSGA